MTSRTLALVLTGLCVIGPRLAAAGKERHQRPAAPAAAPPPLCPQEESNATRLAEEGWRVYRASLESKDPREGTRLAESALRCLQAAQARSQLPERTLHPLGLVLQRLGRSVEAYEALRRFLSAVPEADRKPGVTSTITAHLEELRRTVGELDIDAPPGLEVRLDGALLGQTPLPRTVVALPGMHSVIVGDARRGTLGKEVRLGAGEVRRVDLSGWRERAAAPPPTGLLSVYTNRGGVEIHADGKLVGLAPLARQPLLTGTHWISAIDGRQQVGQRVLLTTGQHAVVNLRLPPRRWVVGLSAALGALAVGTAAGLAVYFSTGTPRPDGAIRFP